MKTNFLFFFILFITKLYSQNYFNKLYNYDNFGNFANTIYEYNNGDFLIAGQKTSAGSLGSLHFIRINSNGDTVYSKRYPQLNHYRYCGASGSLIKSLDNNLILGGADLDSSFSYNALLVKLTEDGDTLWTKTYGGANFDNANIVHQTADSGFVLMGVTQSYSVGPASDFYMIKTDKNGNFEWQKTYGTSATEDCVSGQITLDGGFILSGRKSNMFYIVKTDSVGNFQWDKMYSTTKGVCFIKQLADSSYILTGARAISGFGDQAYIIKINKIGTVIWENHYGSSALNEWFYTCPVILNDGSIVVGGQQQVSSNVWGMLVKVDSMGNQQWLRTYYANSSGNNYVYDIKATSDNGFILVGSGNLTGQDAWVVKVDSVGCEIANCNVGVEENENDDLGFLIYPNPVSTSITIESIKYQIQSIRIMDILGQEFYYLQTTNSKTEIDVSQLPSGIYILQMQSKNGVVSKKFVKE